jgi:hypothetical protein
MVCGLYAKKYGARCLFDPVRLGENYDCTFSIPVTLGLQGLPSRRSHEPSGSQIGRGRTPAFMRRRPRWVARCSVHAPLSKSPQPRSDAKGAGVPERKIGFEAMEASAKVSISSIDCLSAGSFEAARSEQPRLPAEGPLKRGSTLLTIPSLSRERDGKGMAAPVNARSILAMNGVLTSRNYTFRTTAWHALTPLRH